MTTLSPGGWTETWWVPWRREPVSTQHQRGEHGHQLSAVLYDRGNIGHPPYVGVLGCHHRSLMCSRGHQG